MYKILCILLLTICLFGCSGCRLLEDVGDWDISACADGFDICWELYRDNSDKFEDGFTEAMNTLIE